jgi:hypothetical protein
MSRWPIQLCSVRMSTPCRKCSVAKVWRNLWRKKCRQYGPWAHLFPCLVTHCPQFNSARSATRLTIMSFSLSGFPFELGNTSCEGRPFSAFSEFLQLLYKSGRERHGAFLPVFRSESPKRFGSHAHQTIAKIHVTPSDMTNLPIPETRSEQELEKYAFILVRVFEHGPISSAS